MTSSVTSKTLDVLFQLEGIKATATYCKEEACAARARDSYDKREVTLQQTRNSLNASLRSISAVHDHLDPYVTTRISEVSNELVWLGWCLDAKGVSPSYATRGLLQVATYTPGDVSLSEDAKARHSRFSWLVKDDAVFPSTTIKPLLAPPEIDLTPAEDLTPIYTKISKFWTANKPAIQEQIATLLAAKVSIMCYSKLGGEEPNWESHRENISTLESSLENLRQFQSTIAKAIDFFSKSHSAWERIAGEEYAGPELSAKANKLKDVQKQAIDNLTKLSITAEAVISLYENRMNRYRAEIKSI